MNKLAEVTCNCGADSLPSAAAKTSRAHTDSERAQSVSLHPGVGKCCVLPSRRPALHATPLLNGSFVHSALVRRQAVSTALLPSEPGGVFAAEPRPHFPQ